MKVEIDTINKTIKIIGESTWEELSDIIRQLPEFKDYKFIPNTIINTIDYTHWITPSPYTTPIKPWWEQPYTITF